ncbi:adenosylhomocysteinase [Candidatus Aerophobetes bacterium]|uniref:Adenosylhomocysteinase n=1 Tax=Aerophobetes bacterium TaxID=2030807 RepID=A0A662DLP9_UNCAE|nr:MAG: adenosylhomocysteinase [Candidatus Aerophobetes bacterium]
MEYDVKNTDLASKGKMKIEWAASKMRVLGKIKERFLREKPLKGIKISACLHVTSETANLMDTLKSAGAKIRLCASNPLSTQDDVAASLVKDYEIEVFAVRGEDKNTYYKHIHKVLQLEPDITMDDGADLVSTIHSENPEFVSKILGGTEETTTGVIRLRSLERENKLKYPIIAVNDADTKHLFDNRYGTGQSTIDGILRATNYLLAGSTFVVCGYGWCGRGVAMRARGMGARVVVCEVNPLRALEAVMDGFWVMPLKEACPLGDIFVTSTGDRDVIRKEHFLLMKDGALVANSGHFNVEINLDDLAEIAIDKREIRKNVEEFKLKDGRKINLLAQGRLVNLAAAEGHPSMVMDMSFANQALCCEYLGKEGKNLQKKVYKVPVEIDEKVAVLKLESMGIKIDELTEDQKRYLSSWEIGT